jgi:hypothetical protein
MRVKKLGVEADGQPYESGSRPPACRVGAEGEGEMTAEENIEALREERRRAEAATREHLTRYVASRAKACEALSRVDPHAQFTRDAKQLLEKAERDLAEYEAYLATAHDADSPRES